MTMAEQKTPLHFNSHEVAKILQVNVSTIKRWTEEGKLDCVRTHGGHRRFLMNHLAEFLKAEGRQVDIYPVETEADLELNYHILKRNYPQLQSAILTQALQAERDVIQKVITGLYLNDIPVHTIYDEILTPVLHEIGQLWSAGELAVAEEHLASQTIRDAMIRAQGSVQIPQRKSHTALCVNLSGELHDIALKMVDHVLEARGFQIYFSGQITPLFKMKQIFRKYHPERLYISSTFILDAEAAQNELKMLCDLAHSFNTRVFVGGQGFTILDANHPAIVRPLKSFADVYES